MSPTYPVTFTHICFFESGFWGHSSSYHVERRYGDQPVFTVIIVAGDSLWLRQYSAL